MTAAIARIDHLFIVARDADGLFRCFADTLHLPVAWPMADFGGFTSAGVRPLNLNMEFARGDPRQSWFVLPEGSAAQYGELFGRAGLRLTRVVPTGSSHRIVEGVAA